MNPHKIFNKNNILTDSCRKPKRVLSRCFFSLILLVSCISTVEAQISNLGVGDKVRITAPFIEPMNRIKGTISEMSGNVLVLSSEDSLIYISNSLIQNLEISTGKRRVIGRGMLIGAVAGTMIAGAISAIRNNVCGPSEIGCSTARSNGSAFVSGGTTGLLSGVAAGAITGFFVKIDDWERTPVRVAFGISSVPANFDKSSIEPNISFKIGFGD